MAHRNIVRRKSSYLLCGFMYLFLGLKTHFGHLPSVLLVFANVCMDDDNIKCLGLDDILMDELVVHSAIGVKGGGNGGNMYGGSSPSSTTRQKKRRSNGKNRNRNYKTGPKSSFQVPKEHQAVDSSIPPPRSVTVLIPGYGKAEGRREGGVDIWKGIPYAQPPVGALRFAPPEAAQPWAPSRLDASNFGPDCFQIHDPVINPAVDVRRMSEDCLYLNVFTPAGHTERVRQGLLATSGSKLLPVMVWLHGGGFQQGGARRAEYDGRRLAERDIVVVTLNYRLGALGFLVSTSDGIYGNFGLMDQRAAIEWVKSNIKAFGGDPDNITLFGESAGAVMIGLHLLMEGAGNLFHKAIMQSNPLGYTFRSVIIGDFIGDALKKAMDCRDLACLRAEKVEEILRAQRSFMGVPRSVGDFFTWGPTLTKEVKLKISLSSEGSFFSRSDEHRLPRNNLEQSRNAIVSEWRLGGDEMTSDSARWSAVNVSQTLQTLDRIPDSIPIMIGTNKHEGEIFIQSAFPAPMPKAIYWMFVGAFFRDSASRILQHYRGLVDKVEKEAEEKARKQLEEEENRQYYMENRRQLDTEYELLLAMNTTRRRERVDVVSTEGVRKLVNAWSGTGFSGGSLNLIGNASDAVIMGDATLIVSPENHKRSEKNTWVKRWKRWMLARDEKRIAKLKAKALREAAKVVVDYRPVMSAIINDYLFRCPSWHFAQLITEKRNRQAVHKNNVYVYRFSQPTHIPGYKECWGKSCHTAEMPYVFQAMDVIRSNYSTLGPYAQKEAPSTPDFPYTQIMAAYRGAIEAVDNLSEAPSKSHSSGKQDGAGSPWIRNHTKAFQQILDHFFGDYFKEDADEELASDMADRWASFARGGNPNYEGSKAEWLPWRNENANGVFLNNDFSSSKFIDEWKAPDYSFPFRSNPEQHYAGQASFEDTESDFYDEGQYDAEETVNESSNIDHVYNTQSQGQFHRSRALEALQLTVVEEDVFRTELRRLPIRGGGDETETSFLRKKFFFSPSSKIKAEVDAPQPMSKSEAWDAIQMAQDYGVIGTGLRSQGNGPIFYPELFELSWPPQGRLIERDCTCDLWDRIRYRY